MKINIVENIGGSRRILKTCKNFEECREFLVLNFHKLFAFFKNNENYTDIFELLKISENNEDISYIFNLLNVSWYSLTLKNEIVKNDEYYKNIQLLKQTIKVNSL